MDFTREPIIETIITPRDGFKLAVRNTKTQGLEDHLVDAVEVISFGGAHFFRSLEKPKAFLLPASDYEITEVRETRMVLKTSHVDRSIKIGGGKVIKESDHPVEPMKQTTDHDKSDAASLPEGEAEAQPKVEPKVDKKRDRRRQSRKRRSREEDVKEEGTSEPLVHASDDIDSCLPLSESAIDPTTVVPPVNTVNFSALLQPPATLIFETINRYRENDLFKDAFYQLKDEEKETEEPFETVFEEEVDHGQEQEALFHEGEYKLTEEEEYKPHEQAYDILNDEDDFSHLETHQEKQRDVAPVQATHDKPVYHHRLAEESALSLFAEEERYHGGDEEPMSNLPLPPFEEEPIVDQQRETEHHE